MIFHIYLCGSTARQAGPSMKGAAACIASGTTCMWCACVGVWVGRLFVLYDALLLCLLGHLQGTSSVSN